MADCFIPYELHYAPAKILCASDEKMRVCRVDKYTNTNANLAEPRFGNEKKCTVKYIIHQKWEI